MSKLEPVFEPITINFVTGGTPEQQAALMGCSFDSKSVDAYFFYDKQGKEKSTSPAGRLSSGRNFTFIMDGLIWTIHDFHLDLGSNPQTARGKWRVYTTLEHIHANQGKTGDIEDDPTFQAQSGIHVDYEAAASANA
jgi:hypothetical protein